MKKEGGVRIDRVVEMGWVWVGVFYLGLFGFIRRLWSWLFFLFFTLGLGL